MSTQLSFLDPVSRPRDPFRSELWHAGLTMLAELTQLPASAARKLLGRLEAASEKDRGGLLAVIRDAHRQRPDDPVPYLVAAARNLRSEAGDPWGLGAWYRESAHAQDWPQEALEGVLAASGLATGWRGSLACLEAWLAAGYRPDSIEAVIAEEVGRFAGEIRALAFFDRAVRRRALRWHADRCEWLAW